MRTRRALLLVTSMVALLVIAGCGASPSASTPAEDTSTPTATVATAPVGPMLGSNPTTMPGVVGLNLHIAAERFVGMGDGARLFTDKYHGEYAKDVYAQRGVPTDDPVVTTTSPTAGALLHGDPIYLSTGALEPRNVGGYTVGPYFFKHGVLVKRVNDQGCLGCHAPEFCQRCHNGYKVGTAGMAHPPVTVESVVRDKIAATFPEKQVTVKRVVVSGADGYAVYLVYADPASATSQERAATEGRLAAAIAAAKLKGVGSLTVVWSDSNGRFAASDKVPLK